jgi:hypothetical protein
VRHDGELNRHIDPFSSHPASSATNITTRVTISPAFNNATRLVGFILRSESIALVVVGYSDNVIDPAVCSFGYAIMNS